MEDREPTPKEVQTEEEKKVPLRKSRRRIFLKALLWILGVILLLPAAVYIPFVQDFLKDTACSIIEKSTGMKVEIGKFRLRFPLKVSLQDLLVTPHPGDTMAQAKEALVDVRMLPLLHLDVQVEKLQLTEEEIIRIVRNGFEYSICGQHYLPAFDRWVEDFYKKEEELG